jgi:hypothetical protein
MVPAPDAAERIAGGILIALRGVRRPVPPPVVACETTAPGTTGTRRFGNVGPAFGTFNPNWIGSGRPVPTATCPPSTQKVFTGVVAQT